MTCEAERTDEDQAMNAEFGLSGDKDLGVTKSYTRVTESQTEIPQSTARVQDCTAEVLEGDHKGNEYQF